MKCPRCSGNKFWILATGQKRCSQCGLTIKFERRLWQLTIISPYWKGRLLEFFCLGVPDYRLRFQVPLDVKIRANLKAETISMESKVSGHMRKIGFTIIVECLKNVCFPYVFFVAI